MAFARIARRQGEYNLARRYYADQDLRRKPLELHQLARCDPLSASVG